ncbi:ABC transporter ATP-binding protein [Vibrio sonorensis]|uniref:ABC transporter ATP-binding protein n=1 Tax=Vibrio sonorensis TaxID=1004316 RepID=UPI0008DA8508|nr:ABC transporter ATP-binding protein [Vibrio sonorensis]
MSSIESTLVGEDLHLGYQSYTVSQGISVSIPKGKFTVIIGPNGCGKSTLLKSLCRLITPKQGQVLLDGKSIHNMPTKQVAKAIGLLPQTATAPEGIRVFDLVSRGRFPHQGVFKQWSEEDQRATVEALSSTGTLEFADRGVDQLSGGQRQRVWIAMALAQETPILMLDEPTTYLDITHQFDLLDLFRSINLEQNRTLVAVLHDLNQACRYADHIIAMKQGKVVAEGSPKSLITESLIKEVFEVDCVVIPDPLSGSPLVIPKSRHDSDGLSSVSAD